VIQELGIYEDIHEEEIKKARNITDIRDLYFTKGAKLDPYWENLGKPKTERRGWIPVTERLPEEDTEVLIAYRYKEGEGDTSHTYIDITTYGDMYFGGNLVHDSVNGNRVKHWRQPFAYFTCNYEVIAWMPLPEPYKTESEDRE
jgi:hypothetical protein